MDNEIRKMLRELQGAPFDAYLWEHMVRTARRANKLVLLSDAERDDRIYLIEATGRHQDTGALGLYVYEHCREGCRAWLWPNPEWLTLDDLFSRLITPFEISSISIRDFNRSFL